MQITSRLHIAYHSAILLIAFLLIPCSGLAQEKKNDGVEKASESKIASETSLEGITEALLVDGQPAVRILSSKSGTVEIRRQLRDNQESLMVPVTRLSKFGLGYLPKESGELIISKSRIIYSPSEEKKHYFNVAVSDATKLKSVSPSTWSVLSGVTFDVKNETKRFTFGGGKPAFDYVLRAMQNFDAALAEFKQLTSRLAGAEGDDDASVAQEDELEISDSYDRFKDLTILSTSKMLLRGSAGNKRPIRAYAEYNFAGKVQKSPVEITLYFTASGERPVFREDDLEINFLVDDKRIPLGRLRLSDEEKIKSKVKQTVSIAVPYEMFLRIAGGKKVEFQIGKLEYEFTNAHLDTFQKLINYKVSE